MKKNFSKNRRSLLKTAAAASSAGLIPLITGCSSSTTSYLSKWTDTDHKSTIFYWTDIMLQSVRDLDLSPLESSRIFALSHLAGSVAIGNQHSQHQILSSATPTNLNAPIAYGVAFSLACEEGLGRSLLFARKNFINAHDDQNRSTSVAWAQKVAHAVIQSRTQDGSQDSISRFYPTAYAKRNDQLAWSPTGPFYGAKYGPRFESFQRGLRPGWGAQKTWCISSVTDYEAKPFPRIDSAEFSRQITKVKELGSSNSKTRTDDQSEIALFWEDGPRGITGPGHFQLIAMQLLNGLNLALKEQAKFLATLSLAQADAAIIAWHNKYKTDIIRPETAIRFAGSRFNLNALEDRRWQSYIPTPYFPTYISGHSIFGAASCEIIALIIGTDKIALRSTSPDQVNWRQLKGVSRSWSSLRAIAEENGMSREYGGVHWEIDNTEGLRLGYQLANDIHKSDYLGES